MYFPVSVLPTFVMKMLHILKKLDFASDPWKLTFAPLRTSYLSYTSNSVCHYSTLY